MDYSKTLHLPETEFPMRGNLPQKEPGFVEMWQHMNLHQKRLDKRRKEGAPSFVLHDGPPYANGKIHIGHALNKTLKDIIVRYKYMTGYAPHYVPGWDTHGLPIEYAVLKESGEDRAKMTPLELRQKCLAYAKKWVEVQKKDFIRMGVLGTWEHPYVTFDPHLEAKQIEIFGEMAEKGYIYKGKKAVYWCPHCETALAEAEIEYKDRKSPSIYVKFPALDIGDLAPQGVSKDKLFAVIWTTTPWTIPANQHISVNPKFIYVWVHNIDADEYYLMNKELAPKALADCKIENYEFVGADMLGQDWDMKTFTHPLYPERVVHILEGNHVTLDAGTGCVHTAPGHGIEDFEVHKKYENEGRIHQDIICPVDNKGRMMEEVGLGLVGKTVWEAEGPIISLLAHAGRLLGKKSIHHSYPHCWRCKNPVIYRATEQWFASINDFRQQALKAVDETTFYPSWGHDRLYNMIRDRQDWCISRQRSWGVPIPAFFCEDTGEYVITKETTESVRKIIEKEGSGAWWKYTAEELLPEGFAKGRKFRKEMDIMDVWFDSGSSWNGVLNQPKPEWEGASYPCDLYLEGSDQHRGWFHSSLLTSVAVNGHAPYKAVLTHGFTVDGEGRKMSKSVGNVVAPQDIIDKYGADVMRLWISSVEYQNDVRLSPQIIKSMSDVYRKIRNTFRYLLGNLNDFDPVNDVVSYAEMDELDRWALLRLEQIKEEVTHACEQYQFHVMYHAVHNFCTVDLSAIYLDILKDRLYTENADSVLRRSAQTAMYEILNTLVRIMAPFICFTAEEVWQAMPQVEGKEESVHLADWPTMKPEHVDSSLAAKWEKRLQFRTDVMKALENARATKLIGHPLDADLTIYAEGDAYETLADMGDFLADFFIVSTATLVGDVSKALDNAFINEDGVRVVVTPSTREKCERCWKHVPSVGSDAEHPHVCARCARVLHEK